MGSQRMLNRSGGFSQYLYVTDTRYEAVTINGITAKVIRKKGDEDGHGSLPSFTNTSDMYFKEGKSGDVIQGRYYDKNRMVVLDIDWGHNHYNDPEDDGNGERFDKGVAHVQLYTTDQNGKIIRKSNDARLMTADEIKKFGAIILHFNPKVRFK